jgi:hypothetical protein
MDRTDDLVVAGAAALGTLILVVVSVFVSVDGIYTRALPVVVYFVYTVVHDADRNGRDRPRTWVGLTAVVTLATMVWYVL